MAIYAQIKKLDEIYRAVRCTLYRPFHWQQREEKVFR